MTDRFKYAEVRQRIIDMLKTDLQGPLDPASEEVLGENPRHAYIVGVLAPQTILDGETSLQNEQEVEADIAHGDGEDYTPNEDDENEPVISTHFQTPSSIGISFYLESSTHDINIDVSWGDYAKTTEKHLNKDGKEVSGTSYKRIPVKDTITVELSKLGKSKEYQLPADSNVILHLSRIFLKNGYSLVTAYVINKRSTPESEIESLMFQVHIKAYSATNEDIFIAEHICREVLAPDEFYYNQRPILGRGRGCAASWGRTINGRSSYVESDFIPQYEFPGVSATLEGFDNLYFSMRTLSVAKRKDVIIVRLTTLADS